MRSRFVSPYGDQVDELFWFDKQLFGLINNSMHTYGSMNEIVCMHTISFIHLFIQLFFYSYITILYCIT